MTKQEFDKIVAKYEEHKRELDYQYNLGKLHGVLEALRILNKYGFGVPMSLENLAETLIRKMK